MPNYTECLEALPHFRNKLLRRRADPGAFVAAGMMSRDYATGITLQKRRGKSLEGEFALRLFVFEKSEVGVVAQEIQDFEGLPVEVGTCTDQSRTPKFVGTRESTFFPDFRSWAAYPSDLETPRSLERSAAS